MLSLASGTQSKNGQHCWLLPQLVHMGARKQDDTSLAILSMRLCMLIMGFKEEILSCMRRMKNGMGKKDVEFGAT